MNSDAAFTIGKTHKVCQDYARASIDGSYTIIADGCSGSPDSDFGSRLLVKSVENALIDPKSADPLEELRWLNPPIPIYARAIANARAAANVLKLQQEALDATLIVAQYRETNVSSDKINAQGNSELNLKAIQVSMWGDGVVAARRRSDGVLEAHNVIFSSGYPQYLSYRLNDERRARLIDHTKGNIARIETWTIEKNKATCESVRDDDNENRLWFFPIEKYDLVTTFSDGITSFQNENIVEVPWHIVVRDLVDIAPMKGEFVQRSLNWLTKEYLKRKWVWGDDVSMGAIFLD